MSFICAKRSLLYDFLADDPKIPKRICNIFFGSFFPKTEESCDFERRAASISCNLWISLTRWCITFDIKAHLPRNAKTFRDNDAAKVASGVRLLGVVDVDGDVGRGHGHAEAHSLRELVLAVTDFPWAEVYHLEKESI